MSGIARGIGRGAGRVTSAIGEGVSNSAGRAVRQMAHGSERVARNVTEGEAAHVEHLHSLHPPAEGASSPNRSATASAAGGEGEADTLSKKKPRPSLRIRTKRSVFRDSPRMPNGEDFKCPSTGKSIPCKRDADGKAIRINDKGKRDPEGFTIPVDNPPSKKGVPQVFHFGHKPDSEYWRLEQMQKEHPDKVTADEFRNEYNRPDHYVVEHPTANMSHAHESTAPGYGHYAPMLDRLAERQAQSQDGTSQGGNEALGNRSRTPRIRRRP